jgi:ABC-type nitrate/sulfonate/bicarbonate transport system permease component
MEMARTGELVRDVAASLRHGLLGLALGTSAGIVLGMLTGRIIVVRSFLSPLIHLLRPLPPVATIPFWIIWMGIGELSKVSSIGFAVFFPVWISTHIGAMEVPQTFLWSAQTFHLGPFEVFRKVIFPGALPFIVSGFRTGISMAFIMIYVSELAGASSGLGYQISISQLAYRVDRMMAALVVLGLLGALTDLLLTRLLWRIFPWLKLTMHK